MPHLARDIIEKGLTLLAIASLALLALQLTTVITNRILKDAQDRSRQRVETLSGIARSTIKAVVIALAFLLGLQKVGIDITPLLASAGIFGLAIGFGAQSLIKDILSGFFILLEDQYGVGDSVTIGTYSGVVEGMNLRITRLRSLSGELITIPNGTIGIVSNQSKGWARAVVDVGVALHEDVDHVMEIMRQEAVTLYQEWDHCILEEPSILGINEFAADRVSIRLLAKTSPADQWSVGRELRRRIKIAFDREGIQIPALRVAN